MCKIPSMLNVSGGFFLNEIVLCVGGRWWGEAGGGGGVKARTPCLN